jgi:membrane-bound serine protease (ClpP class)
VEVDASAPLWVFEVRGVIGPSVKDYLVGGLARAAESGAAAALIRLDTPGGLLDATRGIVQSMVNAPFPVIVYAAPRGARATSAGLFLMLAADVSAMAPETNLGAAHPVGLTGGDKKGADGSVMEEKAVSDTAAYARALAAERGRNAVWAEQAVRQSLSLTADEALEKDVVDFVADDEAALLRELRAYDVEKNGRVHHVDLAGRPLRRVAMSFVQRLLHTLGHPNVAYILLALGFYALIHEFATPGIGLGGIAGVICLTLAFFSLQVLPLNFVGLALLITGLVAMALDVITGAHGLLIFGGPAAPPHLSLDTHRLRVEGAGGVCERPRF